MRRAAPRVLMSLSTVRPVSGQRNRSVFSSLSISILEANITSRRLGDRRAKRARRIDQILLLAAIAEEVEGEDAFAIGGALQHLWMAQRANGVVKAGLPMLLHTGARKVVILRMALVVLGAIDQVHNVVDFVITKRMQELRLGAVAQRLGKLREQGGKRPAQPLNAFEAISPGAGPTRKLDFLLTSCHLCQGARQFAARVPQIHLKCQSVK